LIFERGDFRMIKKLELKKKIELVDRGLGAEIFSGIVNGIGALMALVALILVIVFAASKGGKGLVLCSIFYGVALFLTHLFSCLYHSLAYNDGKRVFRLLTITVVQYLFMASIMMFVYSLLRDRFVIVTSVSLAIVLLSTLFNVLDFEKFRFVRITGFALLTIMALVIAFLSLAKLPGIAFGLLIVSIISFITSFAFHIFGYQLSYLNSIGHILAVVGNSFLFFTILLYLI
jgi:hemolysin III